MKKYLLLIITVLLTACSGTAANVSDKPDKHDSHHGSDQITITDFADRTLSFPSPPERIIALSNGDMDIIYALESELVGRPTTRGVLSVPEAESVEQIGSTHEFDLEKVTYLRPDVVLGNYPMNQKDIETIASIDSQLVLTNANSIDDITKQITLYGDLLQKQEKAEQLKETIEHKVTSIQNKPLPEEVRVLLVYGAPGTYMVALPNSLSGNMLDTIGVKNIAADFPQLEHYPQYAQLNTERIIEANPQVVLLMVHGNPESVKEGFIKEMEQNAAWNNIDAVINNQIEILPTHLFGTNPGTQITEALDHLYEILLEVESP
ncbi:ABC transporter substrate-binding protein [Alkalihalobacillus sp. LMS39]|uniref:ABC transporter substrate-binding protein n=1 Tax=Alkalihalobacillus sp. LMS39 TaxID=2924032 RepID=UPI001FB1EB86|nr:ABC transporter substrate-binding protein [Alkalihalobacillus sp. LMS39]UOE94587.1 ABC transporter substrate-binding protein [Alkalihalobacillus sp. LMS39]